VVWLVSTEASDPEFASSGETFDTVIYTSPLLGIRGLWPAVDPLRSRSSVEIDERHARIAEEARSLLRDARSRTFDPVLLELLAVRAIGAAQRHVAKSADPDDALVQRARRLEAFLTHPFDMGKEMTGVDGEVVPLAATLDGVESILAGDHDDTDPNDLTFIGALPR